MTMTARELIDAVRSDLSDDGTRWDDNTMLGYINRAQNMVANLRPDVSTEVDVVKLEAGKTRQTVPATARLLVAVSRNMGVDGETPGRPVTDVSQDDLNAANTTWHNDTASAVIYHFTYDEKTPEYYYVTPVPAEDVHLELVLAAPPVPVEDVESTIALDDTWQEALMEWMKRCAYNINGSSLTEKQIAKGHEQSFYVMLGDEARARLLASPNTDAREVSV